MKCDQCQEKLVTYVGGNLHPRDSEEVAAHLRACPICRAEAQEYEFIHQQLLDNAKTYDRAQLKEMIMNRVLEQQRSFSGKHVGRRRYARALFGLVGAAAAAAVIVAVLFSMSTPKAAYAWQQTLEAWTQVRFVHLSHGPIKMGEREVTKDERWVEIGPDGSQVRYRQDSPPQLLCVENDQMVFLHDIPGNTVSLYPKGGYRLVFAGNYHDLFKRFATGSPDSYTIEENVQFKGRAVHRVRDLRINQDVYVDPETKLPVHYAGYDMSYESPSKEIFDIPETPTGVRLVDKRSGARTNEQPDMADKFTQASKDFDKARKIYARGDYAKAAELLAHATEIEPNLNWAWFWLGKAHAQLGQPDKAVGSFSRVIDLFKGIEGVPVPHYCYLARGLAYQQMGLGQEAKRDFAVALPVMIDCLRHVKGCKAFDYAEDPTLQTYQKLSDEQRLSNMINRLRTVTGQDFGSDPVTPAPQQGAQIIAWETWWKEHAAEYGVTAQK